MAEDEFGMSGMMKTMMGMFSMIMTIQMISVMLPLMSSMMASMGGGYTTQGYVTEITETHQEGTGQVVNAPNMKGSQDESYALVYAPNSGDVAYIVGKFDSKKSGTLKIYMKRYSSAYTGNRVNVYISEDGGSWLLVAQNLSVLADSGTWYTISTVTNIQYVKIYSSAGGLMDLNSKSTLIDCVKIE